MQTEMLSIHMKLSSPQPHPKNHPKVLIELGPGVTETVHALAVEPNLKGMTENQT